MLYQMNFGYVFLNKFNDHLPNHINTHIHSILTKEEANETQTQHSNFHSSTHILYGVNRQYIRTKQSFKRSTAV